MTPPRRRLAIAVAPHLLGDALSRVLARPDREVVVLGEQPAPGTGEDPETGGPFDIAVISHDSRALPAAVVIRLPDTPTVGMAHVGLEGVRIDDVESLIDLVERCATALDVEAGGSVDAGP